MPRQTSGAQSNQKAPTSFQYTGPTIPKTHVPPVTASFGQTLKDGFGFGIGSSIARHMVEKLIGGGPTQEQPNSIVKKGDEITSPVLTDSQRILYNQCMIEGGIHELCKETLQ